MIGDSKNTTNNTLTQPSGAKQEQKERVKDNDLKKFEEMFKNGVHFAYSRTKRHPKMSSYIYGVKNNAEVFDLEKTEKAILAAIQFLRTLAEEKKQILFVGTKPSINDVINRAADEIGMPRVANRWIGGTLTNFKVIRNRALNFEKLKKDTESGELEKYTKKEKIKINKEFERMKRIFSGLENLIALPEALIIVDSKEESTALREAKRLSIPVIAILSSDCDPTGISYPIPANDAAPKSVEYIIKRLVEGYKEGYRNKKPQGETQNHYEKRKTQEPKHKQNTNIIKTQSTK